MEKFNYCRFYYPMQLNLRRRMLRKAYVLKTGRSAFPIDWLSWSDCYFRVLFLKNFYHKYRNIMLQRKREERHV